MPPEHEAPVRALYDHEEDVPQGRRHKRAVADWGVSEDVFDRMPGPRFARRGEVGRLREEPRTRGDIERAPRREETRGGGRFERADDARGGGRFEREEDARAGGRFEREEDARGGGRFERAGDARGARAEVARFEEFAEERRVVVREVEAPAEPRGEREADDWFAEPAAVSRTIVIEREPEHEEVAEAPVVATEGRRTIVIGGHPDRLPVPRNRRPRGAVERIGPSPDRIVGYAFALGILLIVIAILTSH